MSNKIDKKELEQLNNEQNAKNKLLFDIGVAEAQKHDLLHGLYQVMTQIKQTSETLEDKYGKISVSLEDGSYVLSEEKEETNTEEKED
mgnify:FL=1|jgi:hypothetical protein|tara:strand:- start:16 stop:279 length:264 start_codon:yes stop_codon:yes gene_type:complete